MTVRLVVPSALREEAGGTAVLSVLVPGGAGRATVADVLDAVAGTHPRLERRLRDEAGLLRRHVNVFVAGQETRTLLGLATPVDGGSEVVVLPSIAGG